jgi:putative transcriptional regulator
MTIQASKNALLPLESGQKGCNPEMENRIRELRAVQRLSQADLADALGVSRQTINALETGKYDPSLPLAFKLAKLFKLRIEEIFLEETTT